MDWDPWVALLVPLTSFLVGVTIFFVPEPRHGLRTTLNLGGAVAKMLLVGVVVWGVFHGHTYETRLPLLAGADLVLKADALSLLFASLSSLLWLVTTVYAIGYLEGAPHRSRFFGFFSFCVSATAGIALAGNMVTFLVFYEILTLATYPLVVHRGTREALRAGRIYLSYTLSGSLLLLVGVVWLQSIAGSLDFAPGGALAARPDLDPGALTLIFTILVVGLGVKAALVPLHGWLPVAMVAPAPVSALLHAVAVVKAGAFGIVRVLYDLYGIQFAAHLGLTGPLAAAAAVTIVYGSIRALYQDELKRRLAYSTVSQVSYIALGAAIVGPVATIGGLVHLVHQGLMKITLFFCAGNLAETLGIHHVHEMSGVGRRMPWTMGAFTLAAFGMIGVPPMAGFISKWYLAAGGLAAGEPWVIAVLVASTLLNAGYFLPIVYRAWFAEPAGRWRETAVQGRLETHWMLLVPALVTAGLALLAGLLADAPFSPLTWVRLIASREYTP